MTVEQATDIDLLDRDRFRQDIPHEWFSWLRANAPVFHHPERDGPGFWVITRYDDVMAVSRDAAAFSSDGARGGVVGLEEGTPQTEAQEAGGNLMLYMDPPDHTRYRRLVNRGFTPRMIGRMQTHIRDLAVPILERSIAAGEADFVVDVAAELPLEVIAELIGVPHEDRHKIFDWSNRMIGSDDPEYLVSQEEITQAQVEMFLYAQELADRRRQDPGDDIITALLSAEIDGESLSDMDFNLFFLLLSVAGNETTRNAISHGMYAFLENPDQYDLLASDPAEHSRRATEEILRWASPVLYFRRNVTRDIELRGQTLRAGDKASIWYVSANRDEEVFEDPFRFDIARDPNPHIAFGGGGPHFCLGAQLARMEIQVLFEELARRVHRVESLGAARPAAIELHRRHQAPAGEVPPPLRTAADTVRSGGPRVRYRHSFELVAVVRPGNEQLQPVRLGSGSGPSPSQSPPRWTAWSVPTAWTMRSVWASCSQERRAIQKRRNWAIE